MHPVTRATTARNRVSQKQDEAGPLRHAGLALRCSLKALNDGAVTVRSKERLSGGRR
jgi:hypothetical protein